MPTAKSRTRLHWNPCKEAAIATSDMHSARVFKEICNRNMPKVPQVEQACRAAFVCCVSAIRYGGHDPSSSAVWEIGMTIAITSFGRASPARVHAQRQFALFRAVPVHVRVR